MVRFLSVTILVCTLLSCSKAPEVHPKESLINDSIVIINSKYQENEIYELDITNDSIKDIKFDFREIYGSLEDGGFNGYNFKLHVYNAGVSVHVEKILDSICIDTLNQSYHVYNCGNRATFCGADSTELAEPVSETDLSTKSFHFVKKNIVQIYYSDISNPVIKLPGTCSINTSHGSFLENKKGYLVFKLPSGEVKGVLIELRPQGYLKIIKTRDINC